MTTRFERVQEMIGNEDEDGKAKTTRTIAHCSPYVNVKPSFLVVKASTDKDGCFVINIKTSIGCLTDKDRRFIDIDLYDKEDIEDLRDFLNYWLEEVKPESAVVTSEIDPIFMESTVEIFKNCVSKRSIKYYDGIHTIGQLVRKTPGNLMQDLRYFSYGKLNRITQRLTDKGLWLGMTEEDIRNWKPQEGDSNEE